MWANTQTHTFSGKRPTNLNGPGSALYGETSTELATVDERGVLKSFLAEQLGELVLLEELCRRVPVCVCRGDGVVIGCRRNAVSGSAVLEKTLVLRMSFDA